MNTPPPGRDETSRETFDIESGGRPDSTSTSWPGGKARRVRPVEVEEADRGDKSRLGHFVLLGELGRGGMGAVYKAWDDRVGRFVALKVVLGNSPESVDRFIREAHIAGKLQHDAVATIFEAGEVGGRHYISMQLIDGEPIDKKPIPILQKLELIRDAARALQYAHDSGIVHRDVKPGNLLLDKEGRIFVTDFGTAKELTDEVHMKISITGHVIGTPRFMSPEQARGSSKAIDHHTDIYSLGTTLYCLLAGRAPFENPNLGELILMVMKANPPPLRRYNRAISPELETAIERTLRKDPAHRYAKIDDFANELDRLIKEKRYVGRYGLARKVARKWGPVMAVGLAIAFFLRFMLPGMIATGGGFDSDDAEGLYRAAAIRLGSIEKAVATTPANVRHDSLQKDVIARIDTILSHRSDFLAAKVLKVRAWYVDGQTEQAWKGLSDLTAFEKRDYRIQFLRALLRIDRELASPPPLPSVEGPEPGWDPEPQPMSSDLGTELEKIAAAKVDERLAEEYTRDKVAAEALVHLVKSRWLQAVTALAGLREKQALPLYGRAWRRAAYLARHFEEIRSAAGSNGTRESLGSAIGLRNWNAAMAEVGTDVEAAAVVHAVLARNAISAGRDPGREVEAGLKALDGQGAWANELRGVLRSAQLRWLAYPGHDVETLYTEVLDLLKNADGWMGRLAAIETRLELGLRRLRHGKPGGPLLEEVVSLTAEFTTTWRDWPAPHVLRGIAKVRMGRDADGWAELAPFTTGKETGALIPAAVFWIRDGEQKRLRNESFLSSTTDGYNFAVAALAAMPDHPVALNLAAAAVLAQAEDRMGRGEDVKGLLREAGERLEGALKRIPDYVEARIHRANLNVLLGNSDAALADANVALERIPEMPGALYLRGIIHFSLKHYREAAEDWSRLIREDASWNSRDLQTWLRQAEARK